MLCKYSAHFGLIRISPGRRRTVCWITRTDLHLRTGYLSRLLNQPDVKKSFWDFFIKKRFSEFWAKIIQMTLGKIAAKWPWMTFVEVLNFFKCLARGCKKVKLLVRQIKHHKCPSKVKGDIFAFHLITIMTLPTSFSLIIRIMLSNFKAFLRIPLSKLKWTGFPDSISL